MILRIGLFLISLSILLTISLPVAAATNESSTFDLAITDLHSAPSGAPGSPLYTRFTVVNKGTRISMTDTVTVYLSTDKNITTADYPVGETEVSFIRPGKSVETGLIGKVPDTIPAGKYYAGALLTIKFTLINDENESDNSITGNQVTINNTYTRPQNWYDERISDLVLNYTNEERAKRNLSELTRDSALDVVAQDQSQDMADRQFFDHVNPSGENPIDRATRHGYNQTRYLPSGQKFYGISENIVKIPIGDVYQFGKINPDDPDQVAKVAIESFMNSISHKTTLLLPEFRVIGLGTSFDGSSYYITQNFF
ncbi:CAP domain-containing protein [uncultured Methanospirillum sp.]|uniref:CAP domain-containing protein n=1 Tax=uncultured Methanospirillum sp. TaxID=262503 RepID=UPI0029C6DD9E|nr:CAP domain-containing protein [uncultured Methanospirillum sp.]